MILKTQTPEQAARFKFKRFIDDGFELQALHEYKSEGKSVFWQIRLKHPKTSEKIIRPIYWDSGKYQIGKPTIQGKHPLYKLPLLISSKPSDIVYITEGEKCTDKLVALGLIATTSGSAQSAKRADWSPLKGKQVIIWPDNDTHGQDYANKTSSILQALECQIQIIDIKQLKLPDKGDVVDWLAVNPNATANDIQQLPTKAPTPTKTEKKTKEKEERKSVATILVDMSLSACDLFQDDNKNAYAEKKSTHEVISIDSSSFKSWLRSNYYSQHQKCATDQGIREAIGTLIAKAQSIEPPIEVFRRVGISQGYYYLDLAQPGNSRAIEIKPTAWKIIDNPPCRFLRSDSMQALPDPDPTGSIDSLWGMLNIPEKSRVLVIAWLLECLRLDSPFPVLELIGEQGSAKSTTQKLLRDLIDPSGCNLRTAPKTVDDIYISAGLNHIVSYENLSRLTADMQDGFCTIATGGGYSKRRLYTDNEEIIIKFKRPIVINSISPVITAQDLIDRTVSVELPIINQRIEVKKIHEQFELEKPNIIGGLLNCFVAALKHLPTVVIEAKHQSRLVEFVKLGLSIEQSLNLEKDSFIRAYQSSRSEAITRTLDTSPAAAALIEYCNKADLEIIEMTTQQLFTKVSELKPMYTDAWPKSSRGFAETMRRYAPALRQMGINCQSLGKRGSNVWWRITIEKI
jgi:hypothetical protein